MDDLFGPGIAQTSCYYRLLRDNPDCEDVKRLAAEMWHSCSRWLDPDFPQQFAIHVHERFWEMYLCSRLLEQGFELQPKGSSRGPDFHILLDGEHLWIEATAPTKGAGIDAVPSSCEQEGDKPIAKDKIILRFTSAISEKMRKRDQYIERGIVSPQDPFIIAVNGGGIDMVSFERSLPAIVKAVYPLGDYSVTFNLHTGQVVRQGYQIRCQVFKRSGGSVPTTAFCDRNYSGISGILYSSASLWDMPVIPGCEILFLHNPLANSPLKRGWFGIGTDCHRQGDRLMFVTHPRCV